jgi:hypothetical protein
MCPNGQIPLIGQIRELMDTSHPLCPITAIERNDSSSLFIGCLDNRSTFICRGQKEDSMLAMLHKVLNRLPTSPDTQDEPMVNLVLSLEADEYLGIIFPRKAHRPSCYYREAPDGILVSPGAVDMGGLVILPRKEDYEKMDKERLLEIFAEVCQGREILTQILQ